MAVIGIHEVLIVPSLKGGQSKLGRELDGMAGPAGETAGRTMGSRLGGALKAGALVAGGAVVGGLGAALVKGFSRLSAIEDARAKLSGLGNSAKDVDAIMTDALNAVKGTSFGMDEAATIAASAVAAGIKPGQELERTLRLTGDAATIAGTDLSSMGSIVNKVATSDMMQMDVANQMMDAGIPILQMVGDELGVTAEEARKMASAGEVSFETFQNALESGVGGAALKSGETLQGAFKNSMAAIGRFGANLLEGVYPQLSTFFNAFMEWMGPVEELGKVIGERLGQALTDLTTWIVESAMPAFRDFGDWIRDNREPIALVATAVAGLMAGFALYQAVMGIVGWMNAVKVAMLAVNAAMRANPIGIIITILGALIAVVIYAYNEFDWFKNIVDTVWAAVQTAIKFAWEKVIKPVFDALSGFVRDVLGPVFKWLYENIIKPYFEMIGSYVKFVWEGILQPVFTLLHDILKNVVAPIIKWLYESVVKPVFGWIGDRISEVWNGVIKPVFEALGNFIKDHVAPKIERGVQIIGDVWSALKRLFAEPINWVINTVWNNGLKKAFDGVAEAVGSSARLGTIPLIALGDSSKKGNSKGTGGVTSAGRRAAGGSIEGGRPYLVGEFGPEMIFPDRNGFVATALQTQKMLSAGRDLSDAQARKAAGRNPREAMAPMGDGFNWGAAGDQFKKSLGIGKLLGTDQLMAGVDQLGGFVRGIMDPLMNTARSFLGGAGKNGELALGAASKSVKMVLDWALKKDQEATEGGSFGGDYTGDRSGFVRPGSGPITSRFGSRWGGMHSGIDLAMPIGSAVRAAWSGVVQKAAWNALTGRTGMGMVLGHGGGRQSYYGHLSQWLASPGQNVKAGDVIARSGNTGRSTGPHLHFEELQGGRAVNPGYLFRDQGGHLPPGLSMVLNNTGTNEHIFNQKQLGKLDAAVRGNGFPDVVTLVDESGGILTHARLIAGDVVRMDRRQQNMNARRGVKVGG